MYTQLNLEGIKTHYKYTSSNSENNDLLTNATWNKYPDIKQHVFLAGTVTKISKLAFRLKMLSGVLQLEQTTIDAAVLLRSWDLEEDAVFWLEARSSSSLETVAAAPITTKVTIKES